MKHETYTRRRKWLAAIREKIEEEEEKLVARRCARTALP